MRVTRPRASTLAVAAGFLAVFGYAMWLISPRWGIPSPSAIDDWNGASEGPLSLGELLRPFVESPVQRFRPGFELFDNVAWHTLGAPADMTGPNLWNAVRIGLLLAAVGVVPALVARALRPDLSPVAIGALAAIPPAVVITGPATPVDLARLAPQEPLLVGATVCGAALVLAALDRHVAGRRPRDVLVPMAVGWPLFALGATFKEASISFLVAAPFVYVFLFRRWRDQELARSLLGPLRRPGVAAIAAALVVPLLWVAFRSAGIGDEGADLYQAGAPSGTGQWSDRLERAWDLQRAGMTPALGVSLWHALTLGVPFLAAAVWLDRKRAPWLALGVGLAAAVALAIQGLPAVVTSRYYLPTTALLAMAAVLLLAQGRAWLRWAALAAAAAFLIGAASPARNAVVAWSADEKATSSFVEKVATLAEAGCPIHASGLDIERAEAFPRLLAIQIGEIRDRCPVGDDALVVSLVGGTPDAVGDTGVWAACERPWRSEHAAGIWVLMRCGRLDDGHRGPSGADLLQGARLAPGVGPAMRAACLRDERDVGVCDRPTRWRTDPWP